MDGKTAGLEAGQRRGKEEGGWGRGGARLGDGHEVAWYEYLGHSRGGGWKAALSSCGFIPLCFALAGISLVSSFHLCLLSLLSPPPPPSTLSLFFPSSMYLSDL